MTSKGSIPKSHLVRVIVGGTAHHHAILSFHPLSELDGFLPDQLTSFPHLLQKFHQGMQSLIDRGGHAKLGTAPSHIPIERVSPSKSRSRPPEQLQPFPRPRGAPPRVPGDDSQYGHTLPVLAPKPR